MSLFTSLIVQYIADDFDVFELDKYLISKARISDIINQQYLKNREFFSDHDLLSLSHIDVSFIVVSLYAKLGQIMSSTLDVEIFNLLDTNKSLPFENYNQWRDYIKHTN